MEVYSIPRKKKSFLSRLSLTTWLIIVNVFVFIVVSILWSVNFLSQKAIAISPYYILNGQYLWTFVSSMFMHAGFFHLFVNMLSLFFVGSLIEKILGRKKYFAFYLVAGIFASLLFVLSGLFFPADLYSFAVGASGALFGLIGLLMFLTPNLKVYLMFIPIPIKMKYAAPGMLVVLWLISLAGNIPLGNFAHLGGLVVGIVYGIYLKRKYPKKTKSISRHFS